LRRVSPLKRHRRRRRLGPRMPRTSRALRIVFRCRANSRSPPTTTRANGAPARTPPLRSAPGNRFRGDSLHLGVVLIQILTRPRVGHLAAEIAFACLGIKRCKSFVWVVSSDVIRLRSKPTVASDDGLFDIVPPRRIAQRLAAPSKYSCVNVVQPRDRAWRMSSNRPRSEIREPAANNRVAVSRRRLNTNALTIATEISHAARR